MPLPLAVGAGVGASKTVCVVCTIVMGLLMEGHLNASTTLTPGVVNTLQTSALAGALPEAHAAGIASIAANESPDQVCQSLKLCDGTCNLFLTWPVVPPQPAPPPTVPHLPPGMAAELEVVSDAQRQAFERQQSDTPTLSDEEVATRVLRVFEGLSLPDAAEALRNPLTAGQTGQPTFYSVMEGIAAYASRGTTIGKAMTPIIEEAARVGSDPCGSNITCIIHRVFDQHLPINDADGDNFAPENDAGGFRGGDWRGRDCDDTSADVRPGRIDWGSSNPDVDGNCNGIFGVDENGEAYEDKWCKDTKQMGVAIIGDSAAAHFHIPPAWLRSKGWNLDKLIPTAEDELDWPQCSWSQGFQNTSACPPSALNMSSLYQRIRARNLCAHRDFQAIAVNGARVGAVAPNAGNGIIEGFVRDQAKDNPVLVVFALIGNDVCNPHPGSSHFTPVADFNASVLASFDYLDTKLPPGSHVSILGLVDGRVLWNTMHARIHPLGVPYEDVYDYLTCAGDNPCWGWLNKNETWRNATTAHAEQLNQVYQQIVATRTYKNFDFEYRPIDWQRYITEWKQYGGLEEELIEPVDGFHPSQSGHQYLAYDFYNTIAKMPGILGPENPNNAAIAAKFGNQGGYGPN